MNTYMASKNSYNKLRQLLRNGREERENMPSNIPVPPFME